MKTKYVNILKIFIFVIICFVSVGYAAFGSEMSVSNIVADVRVKSDIRITEIGITGGNISGGYDGLNWDTDSVMLGDLISGKGDFVNLEVTVTNFGNSEMGIYDIVVPEGIDFEISNYDMESKICNTSGKCNLGISKTLNFKVSNNNYSEVSKSVKIDFDFRKMHMVTYEGITNNGYPTSVIDGGNLSFTTAGSIPPKIVAFSNGNRVDYDLYSYDNNKFNYNNVTGDVTLKYKEKTYMTVLDEDVYFKENTYKTVIDSIYFVDYVDTSGAVKTYDLSETSGSKDVVGWITSDNDLYIGSEWNIYSKNLKNAFYGMSGVQSISFDNLNTSEATSMYYMFRNCSSLTSLDVSSFLTSNVKSMGSMFYNLSGLTSLDVSNFDTSKVTNMSSMFTKMSSLTSLDVSNFNTSNVTRMDYMFYGITNLTELDVSNFKTSNVTNMRGMFASIKKITNIDVSNFDTSKVTVLAEMFGSMSSLQTLDISNFNTSKVTDTAYMFNQDYILKTVYVSDFWDLSKVTNSTSMVDNCKAIVGGNGTVYDSNFKNKDYARVDKEGEPGYFTYKSYSVSS